jgi:hypothetical protein
MIKRLLKKIVPKKYHPLYHLHTRTIQLSNGLIQKGPFSGMRYHDKSYSSGSCSKFNGTYEQEIQPIIENEINKQYDVFIDIGSADGYYSVGMALWSNCSKIISFECSQKARDLQYKLAVLNKVQERISIRGRCEKDDLKNCLKDFKNALILCDIEGYEYELLNPKLIPDLKKTSLIIEVHNHVWDKMENEISKRYIHTHDIKSFKTRTEFKNSDYCFPNFYYKILPKRYKSYPILDQRLQETTYLYLVPYATKKPTL